MCSHRAFNLHIPVTPSAFTGPCCLPAGTGREAGEGAAPRGSLGGKRSFSLAAGSLSRGVRLCPQPSPVFLKLILVKSHSSRPWERGPGLAGGYKGMCWGAASGPKGRPGLKTWTWGGRERSSGHLRDGF